MRVRNINTKNNSTMKKFYTLALTLLTLGSTATPALADDDFETVSSLSEGWYRMRLVASGQNTTASESTPFYATATLDEYKQSDANFYPFKLESAESAQSPVTNFVYIGVKSSKYSFKSSTGHYGNSEARSATDATYLNVTSSALATNAFTVGAAWDYYKDVGYIGKYSGSSSTAAFQFAKADVSNYDIWTVKIIIAPSGSNIKANAMVSTTNTANQGLSKVYDNGNFFFTKGATVSSTDFQIENVSGYNVRYELDNENKKLKVYCSYPNEDLKEGGVYTIKNNQKSGTIYYFGTTDDNTLSLSTTATTDGGQYFVCHKEANGQYVFVNVKSGKYLTYKNNSDDNVNGLSESCDSKQKFSLISANSTLTNSYLISTDARSGSSRTDQAGTFIVKGSAFDGWSGGSVGYTDTYSNLFTFEEVTDFTYNTVKMQLKDGKSYASVYLPYAYNLPDGVDAYYATDVNTGDGTTLTMKKIDGTVVPKATAVVLCGTETSESVVSASTTQPTAVEGNKLSGTIADATVTDGKTAYAFSGKFDTIGFYKYTGENLPKGKAYLELDTTSGEANCLVLNFDGTTTGINGILTPETSAKGTYYDLSGRKVANPSHGLYIVNGKKVIL